MEEMESPTPEDLLRLRRTYHEVGHAIVAQFNGLPVRMLGVHPGQKQRQSVLGEPSPLLGVQVSVSLADVGFDRCYGRIGR